MARPFPVLAWLRWQARIQSHSAAARPRGDSATRGVGDLSPHSQSQPGKVLGVLDQHLKRLPEQLHQALHQLPVIRAIVGDILLQGLHKRLSKRGLEGGGGREDVYSPARHSSHGAIQSGS